MRLYRCSSCSAGFAIISVPRVKSTKGGKGITCPLCKGETVDEIDPVKEGGGYLATKVLKWWKSLPEGE